MAALEDILSLGTISGMGKGYEPPKKDDHKDDKKDDHHHHHHHHHHHKVVARDDYYKGDEDSYIEGNVLKNDYDTKWHDLDVKEIKGPKHGTLELDEKTGYFKYTPDKDYYGYDSFKYKAYDAYGKWDWAEVKICIKDVPEENQAPVAVKDYFKVKESKFLKGNVLKNDSDPEGGDLDVVLVCGPKNAKYFKLDEETGKFFYKPKKDYNKKDEKDYFTYKVKDDHGNYSEVVKVCIDIKDDWHKGHHHDYYMV